MRMAQMICWQMCLETLVILQLQLVKWLQRFRMISIQEGSIVEPMGISVIFLVPFHLNLSNKHRRIGISCQSQVLLITTLQSYILFSSLPKPGTSSDTFANFGAVFEASSNPAPRVAAPSQEVSLLDDLLAPANVGPSLAYNSFTPAAFPQGNFETFLDNLDFSPER